jgi:exopolysaccharide biosynthesis predicted pyruvyltransferase EpsI
LNLRDNRQLPPAHAEAVLIGTPGGNSGDQLIVDACERFLRDRRIDVWRSDGSLEAAAAENDGAYIDDFLADFRGMVMFAGGGNIGIYPDNAERRAAIIQRLRPRQHCLVFPQSAFAVEEALVNPQVTVWCRDAISQSLLKAAGVQTALVPDIALYLDSDFPKAVGGDGIFYIRRTRGGDAETIEHGVEVSGATGDLTLATPLLDIVSTLAPHAVVVSDRLHGGLIAMMMRKKVLFLPVGYHKIRAFHDTWFAHTPGVGFVGVPEDLPAALAGLDAPARDLGALFRDYAIPAFDRFLLA